ncbi:MAG: hypothetical protein WC712_00995 [Candidatus Brocadiia bacterium]
MERDEWLRRVLATANNVLDMFEESISAARGKVIFRDFVLDKVEAYIAESSVLESDLGDYIRYSGVLAKDPSWWRDLSDWDSVQYSVSFHCLSEDVTDMICSIVEGNAPRNSSPLNIEAEKSPDED